MMQTVTAPKMPSILIEFYDEDGEIIPDGMKPKRRYVCHTVEDALAAIGQIERYQEFPVVEVTDF